MNRRSFLARLGFGTVAAAAAATGVLDVERLLWVQGEKTIFLPPPPVIAPLAEAFTVGDVFTIAGRYALNPITRRPTRSLQRFVVTQSLSAGSVLAVADVQPQLLVDGPYANVTGKPAGTQIDGRLVKPLMWGDIVPCTPIYSGRSA